MRDDMPTYAFIDTETGGLGLDASLLTISIILTNANFKILGELNLKCRPEDRVYRVTAEALSINKIDLIEHDKDAITYKAGGTEIYRFLNNVAVTGQEKIIPVGKNVNFDLIQLWDKCISKNTWEQFISYRVLDLSSVGQFLISAGLVNRLKSSSLSAYCEYYGIEVEGLHDARADNIMTMKLLQRMLDTVNP